MRGMTADLERARTNLEQHRRSLAMLPPGTPITREAALDVIELCQAAVDIAAARNNHPTGR